MQVTDFLAQNLTNAGGQGYYFSHPLDSEEMTQFLKKFAQKNYFKTQ